VSGREDEEASCCTGGRSLGGALEAGAWVGLVTAADGNC